MDCETYRHSGELSDITVSVDGQDFHLHKFPLFVRSNFFKNHPQLQPKEGQMAPAVAHIVLTKFPGGSKTFSTVADYCYNKGVNVNHENVVEVRSAAEYLEMTGNNGSQCCRGGLATLADNVLFEQLHTAKARRDYTIPLDLLERTRPFRHHADKSGITSKLVESFIDNLAHNGRSNAYDGYRRPDHTGSLNNVMLNENQLATLNDLPLDVMNDLIKQAARSGVNHSLLSHIVQSYIDHNTGLNPKSVSRPNELISIASAILKAENKLSQLSADDDDDKDVPKPLNLISIAGELKSKEGQERVGGSIADAIKDLKDDSSDDSSQGEPDLKMVANLVNIASELKSKDDKNEASSSNGGATKNLIDIAGDILKPGTPSSKASTDEDRLKIIKTLIGTLADLRIEPDFTLPWLLTYMSGLQKLKADEPTKSKFNKWAWEAFHDPRAAGNNQDDLKNVPPEVMIQFARDISDKAKDRDLEKLADLIDRYMTDLDKDNKLDVDTAVKLASIIPKNKRVNFDPLTVNLVNAYSKSPNKSDKKLNELLEHTDFTKLNEKTLDQLNNNPNVPSKKVADAALALAHRLRKELDEYKLLHKPTSSSSHHYPSYSDHYDIKPSSSRPHYNKYDKPFTSTTYDCSPTAAASYYPNTSFKSSIRSRSGDIKSNKLTYPSSSANYSSSSNNRTPYYSSYNNNTNDCESYSYHYHSVDNTNSVDRHDINIIIDEPAAVSNNDVQESIYFSTRTRVY